MKKNQIKFLELENTIVVMIKFMNDLNNKMEIMEKRVSKLVEGSIEII